MVAQTTVPDREPELQQQQQQEQPQQPQQPQQQQQQQQPQSQQPEAAFVDDSFFSTIYANKTRPFSEIVSSVQGNFNFLQDSEIDMDGKHAVVNLHNPSAFSEFSRCIARVLARIFKMPLRNSNWFWLLQILTEFDIFCYGQRWQILQI